MTFEQQRADIERSIEEQRAQEAALQLYFDRMSTLMLEKNLRSSEPGDEVNDLARARTLTVLDRIDSARKRSVVKFLYESGLIGGSPERKDLLSASTMRTCSPPP